MRFVTPDGTPRNAFLSIEEVKQANGVLAALNEDNWKVPHLIVIRCVTHWFELGVLNAMRENDRLNRLQDLLQFLYKQYHYSPKALWEL